MRNNAWYYATDEAKQSYKEARNQERNERHRQARKCEVTNCENEKLPACHYCEEHKCIEPGCDSLKDAGSEYCALHRPSKKQEDVHPKKKIMSMKMPMIFIMIIWTNMRIMMMLRMIGVIIEYF